MVSTDRKKEKGIALILVMGGLAVITVLAAHMTSTSEVTALEAKTLVTRNKLRYAAESAAARSYWLWFAHRQRFPARHEELGSRQPQLLTSAAFENWYADGKVHQVEANGLEVEVSLLDANRGLNLFGGNAEKIVQQRINKNEESEQNRNLKTFLHALQDYRDKGNAVRLYGMEEDGYREQGYRLMPRNGELQFREEVYWVPQVSELFSTTPKTGKRPRPRLRIIPPDGRGRSFLGKSRRPSFFSSSAEELRRKLELSPPELETVLEARRSVQEESMALRDVLAPELYTRIQRNFSLGESGIVTVEAVAHRGDIERKLVLTRESEPDNLHYSKGDLISNWQKVVY